MTLVRNLTSEKGLSHITPRSLLSENYKKLTQHPLSTELINRTDVTDIEAIIDAQYFEHFISCVKTCNNLKSLSMTFNRNAQFNEEHLILLQDIFHIIEGMQIEKLSIKHFSSRGLTNIGAFIENNSITTLTISSENSILNKMLGYDILKIKKSIELNLTNTVVILKEDWCEELFNHLSTYKIKLACGVESIQFDPNNFNAIKYFETHYDTASEYVQYFIRNSGHYTEPMSHCSSVILKDEAKKNVNSEKEQDCTPNTNAISEEKKSNILEKIKFISMEKKKNNFFM